MASPKLSSRSSQTLHESPSGSLPAVTVNTSSSSSSLQQSPLPTVEESARLVTESQLCRLAGSEPMRRASHHLSVSTAVAALELDEEVSEQRLGELEMEGRSSSGE